MPMDCDLRKQIAFLGAIRVLILSRARGGGPGKENRSNTGSFMMAPP
jgi:hypothetical protein